MDTRSKIFVAGGSGMVGAAIIRRLLAAGHTNIVSNYFSRPPLTPHESRISFFRLDLTRQAEVEAFFEAHRPEYVFLAAARVGGILANSTYKADFIYENLLIASNVIQSAFRYGAKKLLNLGSSCIYPKFAPQPLKEEYLLTGELEPTNEPYAIAKIAAIKLCRYYNEQHSTNFMSAMPTNLYGPNDNFDLMNSHVLPAMIRKFHEAKIRQVKVEVKSKTGNPADENKLEAQGIDSSAPTSTSTSSSPVVTLWGTGAPFREFLHVDDLADACLFLMERYNAIDIGEFINIGSGSDLSIRDLAEKVRQIVGFKGEVHWDSTRPDGTPRKLLDVSRMKALGWEPKISLEQGIRETYEWYLKTVNSN